MPHDESQPLPTIRPNNPPHTELPETDRGSDSVPTPQPLLRLPGGTPLAPPGFELGDELGRGGMGVVYAARDIEVGREVAVKLLRPEYAGHESSARRFVEEAQITGQLQHPGIPAVYRVGTLPDGSPFLAMKLVKGRTLAELLKETPDRGRLIGVFEGICQAVGYAHAHGVIHRDLKPQNVMVGAFGEVQVMDWGLAKVLTSGGVHPRRSDTDTEPFTRIQASRGADDATSAGSILGTPAYMPPEQAIGAVDKSDPRSDVFGLGGILCAILTGKPPYIGASAESTRQLAAHAKLVDAFARLDATDADVDLVALCKRCLGADMADRPADAGAVATTVASLRAAADERARQAELDRERAAVRAAEERKRRRVWVGLAVVLAVGAIGSAVFGFVAKRETDRADTEASTARAAEAQALADQRRAKESAELARQNETQAKASEADTQAFGDFLTGNILAATRPTGVQGGLGADVKMSDVLLAAEKDIETVFAGRPKAEALARHAIGETWANLSKYDRALVHLKRAVELREGELRPDHPDTLKSVNSLAAMYRATGDDATAETLYRRVLAARNRELGLDDLETLRTANQLGDLLSAKGEWAAAESLVRRALDGRDRVLGPDHPDTLNSVNSLAVLLWKKGEWNAAEALFRRALAGNVKANGPDHRDTLACVNNLASVLLSLKQYAAAESLFRRAMDGYNKTLGPEDKSTLTSIYNLACVLQAKGEYAAAEPLFRRAVDGFDKTRSSDHPATLQAVGKLSNLYVVMQRYADAVPLLEWAVRGYAKRPVPAVSVPLIRGDLGLALLGTGKPTDAEPHLLAAYTVLSKRNTLSPESQDRLRQVGQGLIEVYTVTGRPEKAAAVRAALPREPAPPPRAGR